MHLAKLACVWVKRHCVPQSPRSFEPYTLQIPRITTIPQARTQAGADDDEALGQCCSAFNPAYRKELAALCRL